MNAISRKGKTHLATVVLTACLTGGSAWAITLTEVVGSLLLAAGRLVFPVAVLLSGIYLVGIFMVHASNGWFVVGAGRNGAEYSVLLIVALLCVGLQHLPSRKGARV